MLIENFRPGVTERLGIGYKDISTLNPRLVYCSMPGFDKASPHRDKQGWEPIVGATTGLYPKLPSTDGPLYTPLPVASTFAAMVSAVSVAMALNARERTDLGQHIETPLHSAMFTAIGQRLVQFHDFEYTSPYEWGRHVMAHQYRCADGRYVQHHGTFPRFVERFFTLADHPEWIEDAVACMGKVVDQKTLDMWRGRLESIFLQRTSQEWEDAINDVGGACTICRTIDEWMVCEHPVKAGMVVEVDDAKYGPMKQPGIQVKLRSTPGAIQGRAPRLGEHTEQVLAELQASEIPQQVPDSDSSAGDVIGALQGIRVLDMCAILAGPTCGRALADYGADVIKIDNPDRVNDQAQFLDVNRGKRSLMLDLKTEQGKEIFWRLVEKADVFVENNREGVLDRLGLGYDDMKKRNPGIIFASLNAFGYDGPWSKRAGWEQLAQGATGMQVRRGGRDGTPMLATYPVADYGTGMMGAYAVGLALLERSRTGLGQKVDTGLALTAGLLQSPFFLDYEGFQRDELEGLGVKGESALSRLYQTSDSWIYFYCPDQSAWQRLLGQLEFAHLASETRFASPSGDTLAQDGALAAELAKVFAQKDTRYWLGLMTMNGISAVKNLSANDLANSDWIRDAGLVTTRMHQPYGNVTHVGVTTRLSRTPLQVGRPAPEPGAESSEILSEMGYAQDEIEALIAAGLVTQA